jgi:hypothetical protein
MRASAVGSRYYPPSIIGIIPSATEVLVIVDMDPASSLSSTSLAKTMFSLILKIAPLLALPLPLLPLPLLLLLLLLLLFVLSMR